MKFLKRRIDAQHSVKELLLKSVGGTESARSVNTLHASDLTKQQPEFCPREVFLQRWLDKKRPDQYVAHAMRVTWDEGRDKQWRINNDYLRDYMWGHWRCLKCDEHHQWCAYPGSGDGPCVRGSHNWEYEEPVFTHPTGFTGSIDAIVQFTPARRRVVEVKIIKGDDYRDLKAPLAEHRVRTLLYLRLLAEANTIPAASVDLSAAHVLYIMRGHGTKDEDGVITPFKEFVVQRDDAAVERYIRMAQALRDGVPQGICPTAMCGRAGACPVVKECFSGAYPPDQMWREP